MPLELMASVMRKFACAELVSAIAHVMVARERDVCIRNLS